MELVIEAGAAFGSGAHPSTQLLLHLLSRLPAEPRIMKVLDLGCGSGVLAIAAAKALKADVIAADLDAKAVAQTTENARLNNVTTLRALRADRPLHPEIVQGAPFDLITCNIVAETILPWLPDFIEILSPPGWLAVSGILQWQIPIFLAGIEAARFNVYESLQQHDWCAFLLQRD